MRHDVLDGGRDFDVVDVAAIWPRPDGGVQAPLGEIEAGLPRRPESAVPDMPAAVGWMVVAVYCAIVAAFALTMGRGAEASFMIAISAVYMIVYLAVPAIFLTVEAEEGERPSLAQFLAVGIHTYTGHLTGRAALAQIMVVPLAVLATVVILGGIGLAVLP